MVKKIRNYKNMILGELFKLNEKNEGDLYSRLFILNKITNNNKIEYSQRRIKHYMKKALNSLLENGSIVKRRDSYRLASKKLKNLLKNKKITKTISKKLTPKIKLCKSKKLTPKTTIKQIRKNVGALDIKSNKTAMVPLIMILADGQKQQNLYKARWQYLDKNKPTSNISPGGWYDYDSQASDIVEGVWQRYIVNRGMNDVRAVKSGEWEYMVDFINWRQTNLLHENHKQRSIRRLDENGKVTVNPYQ